MSSGYFHFLAAQHRLRNHNPSFEHLMDSLFGSLTFNKLFHNGTETNWERTLRQIKEKPAKSKGKNKAGKYGKK